MKTIIESPSTDSVHTFPALYQTKDQNLTVLFTSNTEGTVIAVTENDGIYYKYKIGYYSVDWDNCTNERIWIRMAPGTKITLVQE